MNSTALRERENVEMKNKADDRNTEGNFMERYSHPEIIDS